MAKGMRPGTVQHGVRCMLYEDGTQTSEEYEEVWQAPGVPGTAGEVACLALGLSMGDISGLPGLDAREAHFTRCWQEYGCVPDARREAPVSYTHLTLPTN